MRINDNPQVSAQTVPPNFKAIKSIKCKGMLDKYPQYGVELVDTLSKNPKAMRFFRNHDVDIVFYACKKAISAVESSINIFFKNPAKKKFLGVFGSQRDKITIGNYQDLYNTKDSLRKSVNGLKIDIMENIPGKTTGILDSHIFYKEEEISKELAKKSEVELELLSKTNLRNDIEFRKKQEESLKESIADIIARSNF